MSRGSSDQNSTGDRHLCFPSLSPIVLRVVVGRSLVLLRSSSRMSEKEGGRGVRASETRTDIGAGGDASPSLT